MTVGGVYPNGFVAPTTQELVASIQGDLKANVDPNLDLDPDQPIGQLTAIVAERLADLWELGATAYGGFNPDTAEGDQMVSLAAITGTVPIPAGPSKVVCNMVLGTAASIPVGSVANVVGLPSNTWVLMGPPDADGNPVVPPSPVVDTGGSGGTYPGVFYSTATGPTVANAGTITVITSPVTGWTSVTNPLDAALGTVGDDPMVTGDATALRQRREAEIAAVGACTVDALTSDLLQVTSASGAPAVIACTVLENTTATTDGNGTPPHAFQCMIWDGLTPQAPDNALAQAIWDDKPAGTQAYGTTTGYATDSQGNTQAVGFTRATQLTLYVTVATAPNVLTTAQTANVKAQIKAYCDANLGLGVSVVHLMVQAAGVGNGVSDITSCQIGFSPSPGGSANLSVNANQIAIADTSRMLVNGL